MESISFCLKHSLFAMLSYGIVQHSYQVEFHVLGVKWFFDDLLLPINWYTQILCGFLLINTSKPLFIFKNV